MPKECTTHYHACDCREEMIRDVCRFIINFLTHLLKMASTLENNFVCECSCDICNKARILLDIPEIKSRPETKYDFTKFSYDCQYNVFPLEPETTEYCKRNDCECKEELCPLWETYKKVK